MSRVPPIGLRISSRTQDAPFLGTSQHYYYDQFKHNFLLNRIIRKLRMLKLFSLPTSGGAKGGSAKLSGALTHVVLQPELLPLSTLLKAKQYFSFQLLQSKSFFKTKALPAFGSRFILLAGSNRIPHDDDPTRRSRQHICCYYFTEQNQNGELQFLPPKKNLVFFTDGKRNCQGCETNDEVEVRPRLEKAKFFLSNFELGRKNKVFFEDKNRLEYTPAFTGEIKKKAIKDPKAFFRTRTSNSLKASLLVGSRRNKNTKSFSEKEKAGETLPSSTKNDGGKISFELLKNLCLRPFFTGKNVMQSKKNSYIHHHGVSHWSKNFQDTNAQQLPHPASAHHQQNIYRGTENATVVLASIISLNKHKFRCKLWSTQFDQQLSRIPQCKKDKNKRVTRLIGDERCTATTNNLSKNHSSESAISPLMVVPCRDQGDRPHWPGTAQVNSGADTPTIDRGCFAPKGTHPRFVTQSCSFFKHINILGTAYAQNDVRSVKKTTFFSPVKNKKGSPRIAVQSIFLLACLQQLSNSTNPLMHLLSTHFVTYNKDHTCYVRKNRVFSSGCGEATTTAISNLTFFPLPNSQVLRITNSLVLNRWCPTDAICAETNKRISRATTIIAIDDSEQLFPLMESTFLINSRYIQYANEDLPRIKTNRKVKVKKKNYSFEKWRKQLRNADEQTFKSFKSFNSSGEALPRLLLHRAFASPTELHMFALAECALASSKFNPFQNRSFFVRPWKGCLTLCKHETPFQMSISTQPRVDAKLKKYKNGYFRNKSKQAYHTYPEAYLWNVRKSLAKSKFEERKKKSFLFFFGIFPSLSPSQAFFLRKLFFFAKLEEGRKKKASLFLNWNSKAQTQLFSKQIALSSEKQSFFFARLFSSPFLRKQISLFHQKMSFFLTSVLIMHKLLVSDQSLRYVAQRKNSHLTSRFCPASLGLCRIKAGVLFDLVYPSQIVKQYDQWLKNEKKHSFLTHTLKNSKSIVLKNFISIRL